MKILVTGANGQLGWDVVKELQKQNIECCGATRKDFDLVNFAQTEKFITNYMPDAVIHCAAYTNVDKAEYEQGLCHLVNAAATEHIAEICKKIDAKMLYVSTDYVFGDIKTNPWKADEKAYKPINIYGRAKLEGELAVANILKKHFILRTSWSFGEHGNNFVKTMLHLAKTKKIIQVVNDQIGRPTYTTDLAKLIIDIIKTKKFGCYNATNEGEYISWYDFACEIFKHMDYDIEVIPIPSAEYLSMAVRQHNSKLDTSKLAEAGFKKLPHWQNALQRYLELYK